jgi:hypothetical protein
MRRSETESPNAGNPPGAGSYRIRCERRRCSPRQRSIVWARIARGCQP